MPDRLVRRAIRGMLPYKTSKGRVAFRRIRTYIGVPESVKKIDDVKIKNINDLRDMKFVRVEELCSWLGAKF